MFDFTRSITITDILMILAILLGPLLAVQATRILDDLKEIKNRKLKLFKTLMATRGYRTHWDHVQTLNKIDLEFTKNNRKEKSVLYAWKQYQDLLSTRDHTYMDSEGIHNKQWLIKKDELFVKLLHVMGHALNYDLDETHIKNSFYTPIAHDTIDIENQLIRANLIKILKGDQPLSMLLTNLPSENQKERDENIPIKKHSENHMI